MNEAYYTFSINGTLYTRWAKEWSDIKREHPNAVLIMQTN